MPGDKEKASLLVAALPPPDKLLGGEEKAKPGPDVVAGESMDMGKDAAAGDMMAAFKAGDVGALKTALEDFVYMCKE
jgi:hypothetical protein